MLDEIFEDVPIFGVGITWVVGILIMLYLRKTWAGTSLELGLAHLIIFGIVMIVPAYLITRYWANKD